MSMESPPRPLPNVVLIYIDDVGYGDVGCYACKDIPTANIDRLAKEGVRFTASYIPNPPCCPSRCSLIVGQYAQRFGKYGMSRGLPIPEDRPTLARFLSDRGYVTGQIGKWDIGTKAQGPLQVGFTETANKPPKRRYTKRELAHLPADLQKFLSKKGHGSKYFCVNEAGKTVWLTDYDGDLMLDGTLPEGNQYGGLIANFDFYSTIAALAGGPLPQHCDGVDLFPHLKGERTDNAHEYLFWLNNEPGDAVRRHLIAARWKDWRLYRKYETDRWQLFDLKSDRREERDLAAKYPETVQRMAAQHATWAKTLASLGEIPEIRAEMPVVPTGHGWARASADD
jgi:arylsulfatase A-like enzyme